VRSGLRVMREWTIHPHSELDAPGYHPVIPSELDNNNNQREGIACCQRPKLTPFHRSKMTRCMGPPSRSVVVRHDSPRSLSLNR
jgi:hypothetical protein